LSAKYVGCSALFEVVIQHKRQTMKPRTSNFNLLLLVLFILHSVAVFLWEMIVPFSSITELGYLVPILYVIWFPLESRRGIALVAITTVLLVLGFILNYAQIETGVRLVASITHVLALAILWIAIYFNHRYGKTLSKELKYKEQLDAIFTYATEGIMIVDQLGKIVLANSYAERLFGYQPDSLFGLEVEQLVPANLRNICKELVSKFRQLPGTQPLNSKRELIALRKDGAEFPVEITFSCFKNEDGAFVIAFILDLTEKKEAQKMIIREQRLANTYFEMSPVLFLVLDLAGRVLAINDYGCKLIGFEKSKVVGQDWFQAFLPEDARAEAESYFGKLKMGYTHQSYENPVVTQQGEEIDLSWKYSLINNEYNETLILCSGIDISVRKRQEKLLIAHHQAIQNLNDELEQKIRSRTKELRAAVKKLEKINSELTRSQKLLNAIMHYFPDGMIGVLDKNLRYIFADGQEMQSLGLHGHAQGERVFDNVNSALSKDSEERLKLVFSGGHLSYDVEMADQTYTVNSVPLPDDNNTINEIMVVVRNITERKKVESKLLKAIEKERELTLMKSKFVTMASHEFRTPLTTILSSAFLLENYKGEELERRKVQHLDKIKQAVNNMTELLNDFILLGKLEEGKVKINSSSIDLSQFQEDLDQELTALKKKEQIIEWKLSGENHVYLDKQLLRSVFINLIGNALKYSAPESTVKVLISVTSKALQLRVIDSGIGIPRDEQSHIFERFFRAQNAANIGGTGLGLNIARKHIKLMKGTIEFQSELNEGTTFTVTLPLANTSQANN
jgi:PAS domain S-box-containing protein